MANVSAQAKLEFVSRGISALALVGICCLAKPSHAVVIPRFTLHNKSVPANGILRIDDGVTVRILAADGSEVAGGFIAPGIWRPEQPFVVGTYTADITYEPKPSWGIDTTFEVTPAVTPSVDSVVLTVSPRVDADGKRILERECCLAGAVRPPEPCDAACPPLCVATVYEAQQVVIVTYQVTSEPLDWQLEVREVATTQEGEFTLGYWPVVDSPDELCGVIEVFSWLDESTTTVRSCIANPKPELTPIHEEVTGFGNTSECTIPPLGYEALWCEERRYICTEWLLTPEGAQNQETVAACEHYDQVCNGSGEQATPDSGLPSTPVSTNDTNTSAPSAAETSGNGNEHEEPRLRRVEPKDGCSVAMTQHRAFTRYQPKPLVIALGLGSILLCRRTRSRRALSG